MLSGRILEEYPDTGRGESCLVVGFAGGYPSTSFAVVEESRLR